MPSYEPGKTIWVTLRCDRDKPSPPQFKTKSLSMREQMALTDRIDATQAMTPAESNAEIQAIFTEHLLDWKGIETAFDPAAAFDVLNAADVYQLLYAIVGQVEYAEKKPEAGGTN